MSLTHLQTYSRIDYFLVSAVLISKIQDCYYDSIVISDHGLCCLIYTDDNLVRDSLWWSLNRKWLRDKEFVKYVGKEIDNYFSVNTTQTSASVTWDAFKAYLRGHIISYTSSKSREARRNLEYKAYKRECLVIEPLEQEKN